MKPQLRKRIVREARALVLRQVPEENRHEACLWWAQAVVRTAAKYDVRLVLQAGTASFRRVPAELDDGIEPTHLSYQWNGIEHPSVMRRVEANLLPEMHCWAADPQEQALVDLTVGFQPVQCWRLCEHPWAMPDTPDYLWKPIATLGDVFIYKPYPDAIRVAHRLWARWLEGGSER